MPAAYALDEGFDNVAALPGMGWLERNNSEPLGATGWYQGVDLQFPSFDGDSNSYIAANYQNTSGDGTISDWLVTPPIAFDGASTLTFYTRTPGGFADRLQVRLCTTGDCTDVGTTATDVGGFDTLLLDINPTYDPDGYPTEWTQETVTGLPASGTGRIAFRYFVEDAGPAGTNGNYVGIDRVVLDAGDGGPGLPSAGTSFDPATINAGQPSTLTVTLQNPAGLPATTTAALTDTFPAGLVVAPVPNATTTCGGGSLDAQAGDGAVTLAAGATIPPAGACAITVDVTAAAEGDYQNQIPAGALATDQGASAAAASATLTVLPALAPPTASVAPSTLTFTVAANATASGTLEIADAPNSEPLTFSVQGLGTSAAKKTFALTGARNYVGRNGAGASRARHARRAGRAPARFLASGVRVHRAAAPWAPRGPDGSLTFQLDDGSAETALALSDGQTQYPSVALNRFAPPAGTGAFTIDSVSILWPTADIAGGDLTGKTVDLLAYYDADADGDPGNAVRLGGDTTVTIAAPGTFETYATSFAVPGEGDVYIGYEDAFASGGTSPVLADIGIDVDSPQGNSYLAGNPDSGDPDLDHLGNNGLLGTVGDLTQGQADGNFLVRATGTAGGGAPCTGPIVPWLTVAPASGTVDAGSSASVTVAADPLAANLAAGTYSAEVCVTTNDPAHALIPVPVSLTVTAVPPASACATADTIFCDGFDGSGGGGDIVTGTIGQVVADDADGDSFDFALASFHPFDPAVTSDDVNLYNCATDSNALCVYWYADMLPPGVEGTGGVVDDLGQDYAVLESGDVVGPGPSIKAGSRPLANWFVGSDGYLGVAFYNELTGAVNYGYLHLVTTAPGGYPANALEYAYDRTGAPITIP